MPKPQMRSAPQFDTADATLTAVVHPTARPETLHNARPAPLPERERPLMRQVQVHCLMPDGQIAEFMRIVPAQPLFEEAFASFARGTLMQGADGPVAIEDLMPGDRLRSASGKCETVLWRGSTMIVPGSARQDARMTRLTRIAADAFGLGRPMPDLVLGPHARIVHRLAGAGATRDAFVTASDFIDGTSVIALTPVSAVPVYHLAFSSQQRLVANGMQVESYFPCPRQMAALRGDRQDLFMSLFPNLSAPRDFGEAALPRLRLNDPDLSAA